MFENLKKTYYEGQNEYVKRGLKESLQDLRKLLVMVFLYEKQDF